MGRGIFSATWTNNLFWNQIFLLCEMWGLDYLTCRELKHPVMLHFSYGVGHPELFTVRMVTQLSNYWYDSLLSLQFWMQQRSVKSLSLFSVKRRLLLSFSPLPRRKVWVLPTRPKQRPTPTFTSQHISLPPLQWAARTGTAWTAMSVWVQEKDKRRSSQSTISTKWDFNKREGWSRSGGKRVLVYFRSAAKSRDSDKVPNRKHGQRALFNQRETYSKWVSLGKRLEKSKWSKITLKYRISVPVLAQNDHHD